MRLRISRKESARILSSDNPKGSWKGYKGLKPPGWVFPKDKVKNIPNPFLERPERVMERIPRQDWRFLKDKNIHDRIGPDAMSQEDKTRNP
jgi:hypothetical protein